MSGNIFFEMPPINRSLFNNDEDYQRAVRTSQTSRDWSAGGTVFYCNVVQIPEILVRLVNAAHAVGMGVLHDGDITIEDARILCNKQVGDGCISVDYIKGRPIKTDFRLTDGAKWKFDTYLYNRDQGGTGAAERLLSDMGLILEVE